MATGKTRRKEIMAGLLIGFIIALFAVLHLVTCIKLCSGDITDGIAMLAGHMAHHPFEITVYSNDLTVITAVLALYASIAVAYYGGVSRSFQDMPGAEDGSARWNTDIKAYDRRFSSPKGSTAHDGDTNMILSKDIRLSMEKWTGRNCNILCIGGSGTGKSRYFVIPNILQANCSFVVTDPSGELLATCGKFLEEKKGYKLKVFNTINMEYSNSYNPFFYIRKETDVIIMIDSLIKNTTPEKAGKGDPFWEKSEIMLLRAVCFYLWMHEPKEKQNFSEVVRMVRLATPDDEDKGNVVALDSYFNKLPENDIGRRQYASFRTGGNKTLKSIVISVLARLTIFDLEAVRSLTSEDNISLLEMGDEKQALFIIVPTGGVDSFSFLASMIYTQIFEGLYYHAQYETKFLIKDAANNPIASFKTREECEDLIEELKDSRVEQAGDGLYRIAIPEYRDDSEAAVTYREGSKAYIENLYSGIQSGLYCERQSGSELPVHVRFMLDEFANIGQIPNFADRLATMRKYGISCSIIIQNLGQLKKNYEKDENTMIGNCDTVLFLGSGDVMDDKTATCAKISQLLGRTTIRTGSHSHSKSARGGSGTISTQQKGRPLLTPDEVSMIREDECLIKVRSVYPFRCRKHDLISHPNYRYTADACEGNAFILEGRKWRTETEDKKVKGNSQSENSYETADKSKTIVNPPKEEKTYGSNGALNLEMPNPIVNDPHRDAPVIDVSGKKDYRKKDREDEEIWDFSSSE